MFTKHCLIVLALFAIGVHATSPSMAAIVDSASGTYAVLVQFDPKNISNCYSQTNFSYARTVALNGAVDVKGHRYFVSTQRDRVIVYNSITLEQIAVLPLPFCEFFPTTVQYDGPTDSLWLVYQHILDHGGAAATAVCSMPASQAADLQCLTSNTYAGVAPAVDSSALDADSRIMWTVTSCVKGAMLLGVNVDTHAMLPPVALNNTCSQVQLVALKGEKKLACFSSDLDSIIVIDTKTGKQTGVYIVSLTGDAPMAGSSAVNWSADRQTSSYFYMLSSSFTNAWQEVDIASGKLITNQVVGQTLILSAAAYIPL